MIPLDSAVMRKLRVDKERKHIALVMKQPTLVVPPPATEPLRNYRKEPLPQAVRNRNERLCIGADTPAHMRVAIQDAFHSNRPFEWV